MTVHSFSSAAGRPRLTRARVSGSLPVWSLSLGCPKNRVDTEHLLGSLGMPVHSVEHMGRARLVFINTCGFIEPAVRESIRSILDAVERLGRCKRRPLLAVAGCMVGRYGVRIWPPTCPRWTCGCPPASWKTGPPWCARPWACRGSRRAGPPALHGPVLCLAQGGRRLPPQVRLLHHPVHPGPAALRACGRPAREARGLLAGGVRELVLVAQDLTSWGSDFDTPQRLPHLLDELLPLDRLTWLRLLYLLSQRRHARTAALHARGRAAAAAVLRHPPCSTPIPRC